MEKQNNDAEKHLNATELKKLRWCFFIKEGAILAEPNENLSTSYLLEAKTSLARAQKNFDDADLLWTTVVLYYAEYYALYSFLQSIGVKCENHSCSISIASSLLGSEATTIINSHKEKRTDAQYYMRVEKVEEVEKMLQEGKQFVSYFDELVSNVSQKTINQYRMRLKGILNKGE